MAPLGGRLQLQFFSFATRSARPVLDVPSLMPTALDISSDNKTLMVNRFEEVNSDLMVVEKIR